MLWGGPYDGGRAFPLKHGPCIAIAADPSGEHRLGVVVKRPAEVDVNPWGWYLLDRVGPSVFRYVWRQGSFGLRDRVVLPESKGQST